MSVTWLHISDLHIRDGDPYDRDIVLKALVRAVADYKRRGLVPDLIFATGDIAHSGKAKEYELAEKFFDDLLAAAALDKRRLFVIPGNHDVDRDMGVGLARTLDSREQSDFYFRPGLPKPHLTQKLGAFLNWHNRYFSGIRSAPDTTTCGPIEQLNVNGCRLGVMTLNSALFCQGDDDHDKLWIGRRCLDSGLAELRKSDAEINLVLVHHPLDWLSVIEGSNIQAGIEESCHILLRGHLHETRIESVVSVEGAILHCAAGAAYQSRKWPNRALYGTLDGSWLEVYPIRYEDSPREIWTTDPSVFPSEDKHTKGFQVRHRSVPQRAPQPRRATQTFFRSNIGSRGSLPFVGRDELLKQLANALPDPNTEGVVVLDGPPGVGKSEVAREFARLHRNLYSGGTFFVDASTDAIAINLASIGKTILDLPFTPDLPLGDQGKQTFSALGSAPTLIIYDNVQSFQHALPWLPLSGMPCHVIITTLADDPAMVWPLIDVKPLSHAQSLDLVEKLTGGHLSSRFAEAVARHGGGLPVQIIADATTLAYEQRRGRLRSDPLTVVATAAKNSFQAAYDRLDSAARLLLHTAAFLNPQSIAISELSTHLVQGLGWSNTDVKRVLDTCLDLHLLDGVSNTTMHQLFATFLRETQPGAVEQAALARVRSVQADRFVTLAKVVVSSPADTQSASALLSYPLSPRLWVRIGEPIAKGRGLLIGSALFQIGRFEEAQPWYERHIAELEEGDQDDIIDHANMGESVHYVGLCLSNTGRDEEARPWFERAVAEKEQGGRIGLIDHTSLGKSIHSVGIYLLGTGRLKEAQSWFERAVLEKEKGNVIGQVDHTTLGGSIHAVGTCLSRSEMFAAAQPWFERAVAEGEKGNDVGQIDYAGLASSLHQVGYCLSSMGNTANAVSWFKRAIAEAARGDVHGRIDHESLGKSLHSVGYCLSRMGSSMEARSWFERASVEKEKGDVHGRINHESLSSSLHAVALCFSAAEFYEEAKPWYERAVAEAKQGDAFGHINHDGIGDSLHQLGVCFSSLGRVEEAHTAYQLAAVEKALGKPALSS